MLRAAANTRTQAVLLGAAASIENKLFTGNSGSGGPQSPTHLSFISGDSQPQEKKSSLFLCVVVRSEPVLWKGELPVTGEFSYFNVSGENPALVSTRPSLYLIFH